MNHSTKVTFSSTNTTNDSKKQGLSEYISTKIYQYELQTALYMLEPWEKALFNTLMISIVALSVLTMYQYTPVVLAKLLP